MRDIDAGEYRALFEAAPDGILIVDEHGVVRDANPCALSMFGYAREEIVGREIEDLVPAPLRGAHREMRRGYMDAPRARPMGIGLELRGLRKDGTEIPVEISLSPLAIEGRPHVISIVRDVTERRELRAFGVGSLRAAEEERERIARELHDDTAQRLAGLMLLLRAASRVEDREERARRIDQIREEIADAAEAVRRIARGLRPPALDEVGLGSALESLVRSLSRAHGVGIELDADPLDGRLGTDAELALYRIVQEALTNAVRHADASRIRVALRAGDETLCVTVEDDGRGFAAPGDLRDGGHGLGLIGMRERARNAGGSLTIASAPGAGTRVRAELPWEGRAE